MDVCVEGLAWTIHAAILANFLVRSTSHSRFGSKPVVAPCTLRHRLRTNWHLLRSLCSFGNLVVDLGLIPQIIWKLQQIKCKTPLSSGLLGWLAPSRFSLCPTVALRLATVAVPLCFVAGWIASSERDGMIRRELDEEARCVVVCRMNLDPVRNKVYSKCVLGHLPPLAATCTIQGCDRANKH
jgi:hypothetical protein